MKRIHIRGPSAPMEGESISASGNPQDATRQTPDRTEVQQGSSSTTGTTEATTRVEMEKAVESDPMDLDENNSNQTAADSTKSLTNDNRVFLLQKMKELRSELFCCTVAGMDDPNSVEGKRFDDATRKLERLKKSFRLLFDDEEVLVPGEAPFFQWSGMIFDENKAHFKTVEDCVERFERVLTAYRVDVEDNWKRILPARLVGAVAKWYAGLGEVSTWEEFKKLLIQKYGRRQADIKEEAREKLEHLNFRENKDFGKFIEEFQELQAAADIKDEDCLVRYLFKALPEDLAKSTRFYINNATNNGEVSIKFAIEKVVATYDALFKSKWTREAPRRLEHVVAGYNGGFFGKSGPNNGDASGSQGGTQGYKRRSQGYNSQGGYKNPRLACKYHPGLTNHSEVDCILPTDVKRSMDKAYKKYGHAVKFCNRCKAGNYKEGHSCRPEDLAKLNKIVKVDKKKKHVVPVLSDDDSESEDNKESTRTFAALSIEDTKKECKLDECDFSQPPKDLMKNNSITLPITLEISGCIIKTYFMLDTGASFSCISPTLANKLNVKLNNRDTSGVIKTCQKDNVVKRMGCTDEKIKITYNSRECSANLEVFDIFSDLHVVIGMDLITQLGITISNLAMDWDDDNNVEIPPIDPDRYTPNNQPYGTEEERRRLLDEVRPLLEANKNIDPKSHCTLPDSTFRLHVLESEKPKIYKAQWPLDEKVKPAVAAQIAKWLEHGVIERAPPGNPYNSTLFPVRKKDAQGEYSGDSRTVGEKNVPVFCKITLWNL